MKNISLQNTNPNFLCEMGFKRERLNKCGEKRHVLLKLKIRSLGNWKHRVFYLNIPNLSLNTKFIPYYIHIPHEDRENKK